ncbi:MAG: DUF4331 family protein [Kofleriaceae bacterium]
MKNLVLLGAAAGMAAGTLLISQTSHASDHLDAPAVRMAGNQMADITDVYAWMTPDGAKVNLVMDVSPDDAGTNTFGPSVQYVWHVTSHPGATNAVAFFAPGTELNVMCTFASNTSAQCWLTKGSTVVDYVKGDPSTAMTSADGHMKVFAGRRSDPFFFNEAGFLTARATVESVAGSLMFDNAKCPKVSAGQAALLRTQLVTPPATMVGPCQMGHADCFDTANVMAIVVQVDKASLAQGSDHLLAVWGSTHAPQN